MDTDQEQAAPEADDSEQSGSPAQTVRVPNVSPNAKSGLDHTIIGSNALEGAGDDEQDREPTDEDDLASQVPGDKEDALAWVTSAEDSDTAKDRADAVWAKHGTDQGDASDLATALRSAVYGDPGTKSEPPPTPVVVPDGLTGEDLDAWISGDAVEGDETANPERHAAYLARIEAAAAAGHARPGEADDQAGDGDTLLGTTDTPDQAGTDAGDSKDPNATDADES